jgi:hypothetical protein
VINGKTAGTVNYADLDIILDEQPMILALGAVPSDATVIEKVWKHARKDGGPDGRYKGNVQYPVCAYTNITFSSNTGLNVTIQVSKRRAGQPLSDLFSGDFLESNADQNIHEERATVYDVAIQKNTAGVYLGSGVETPDNTAKSWLIALLLCLFGGWLGLRFFVRKIGTGLLMLLTFGGFGIWEESMPAKKYIVTLEDDKKNY